jgi:hypothetical protein
MSCAWRRRPNGHRQPVWGSSSDLPGLLLSRFAASAR